MGVRRKRVGEGNTLSSIPGRHGVHMEQAPLHGNYQNKLYTANEGKVVCVNAEHGKTFVKTYIVHCLCLIPPSFMQPTSYSVTDVDFLYLGVLAPTKPALMRAAALSFSQVVSTSSSDQPEHNGLIR